ncbi:GNAT family N-acetyltransferase [Chryseobacterium sp. Leaf201]|uniref:GNAT family N-acetyltransferase n=1 Tax=Chryseobacterium sp. Leaf201 TaxID=1735672 RepID=UPI0006FFF7D7|nr:GNAT family N-acetyltransferase [Chryseobacterium sp. Leaf201]KQM44712.1 hypothetical protein ASE55_02755 [Chryseobacterium sp. Leaf201]
MYNVLIRPLVIQDALTSYQWRNDNEVWKYTGSRPNIDITAEIESSWIEKVLQDISSKRFAILCNTQYIGNIQLTNIKEKTAEFHIFIGNKDFWGKGISQLATYQILYYAKEILKLDEVYLTVRPENKAAVKSYQNNNFSIIQETEEFIKMSLKLSELSPPTLSIFVMVYNHGIYLKECLDSLLMQKTAFNYDIVIGEDCSTDHSREILLNYQKLYPGKFKLLLHDKNIGAANNQEQTYKNCTGKYIAVCEGDDYWTDPLKLQKQVDFLEGNNDYSMCFHNVEKIDIEGKILDIPITESETAEKAYTIEDLAEGNFIHTASVIFRKNFEALPSWIISSPAGDYPIHMINASYGLIKYFPEKMGAYRIGQGIWSSQTKQIQYINTIFVIKLMIANLSLNEQVVKNLNEQIQRLILYIRDTLPVSNYPQDPEKAAYSLSIKKLIIILLKKIRYSF